MKKVIIGDIHGCLSEIKELVDNVEDRHIIAVGDLTDRQPDGLKVIEYLRELENEGKATVILGNHDRQLIYYFDHGQPINWDHEVKYFIDAVSQKTLEYRQDLEKWLKSLPAQKIYKSENSCLIIEHGDRFNDQDHVTELTSKYEGATLVHGHMVSAEPKRWSLGTINCIGIDTGCCLGGSLTGYLWPEDRFISVKSHNRVYRFNAQEASDYFHKSFKYWRST